MTADAGRLEGNPTASSSAAQGNPAALGSPLAGLGRYGFTISLYGPSGTGKSTVGRQLAEALGLPFRDLDAQIEAQAGVSINDIFASQGEAGFRQRERAALEAALEQGEGVIALGGGTLLDPHNRQLAEAGGPVVCLSASFDALRARLQDAAPTRPLLAGDSPARLRELLERRASHYASFPLQAQVSAGSPQAQAWEIQVRLGLYHVGGMGPGYDVRVLPGGLALVGEALQLRGLRGPIALVSDGQVARWYLRPVAAALQAAGYRARPVLIPPGEASKTLASLQQLWAAFLEAGVERSSTVLALGGGVVSDLAGFAAATFARGVSWAVLPTSLLGMVDASLGGKTGVDLPQGKNLVGAFHPPGLVLVDPQTLATLPEVEARAGLAEVVKHGLIGDPALFELCTQGWEALQERWEEVVRRAVGVKVGVIQVDPFEKGQRALLNLGHTVGHAVEQASGYRLRHGEAVAIGMVVEARLAERLGLAESGLAGRVSQVLQGLGLPYELPAELDLAEVLAAMRFDKKRRAGQVRFALPQRVGQATMVGLDDLESVF